MEKKNGRGREHSKQATRTIRSYAAVILNAVKQLDASETLVCKTHKQRELISARITSHEFSKKTRIAY